MLFFTFWAFLASVLIHLELGLPNSVSLLTVSYVAFSSSLSVERRLLLPTYLFLSQSLFLLETMLHPSAILILSLHHNPTVTMARNRKPPGGRTTATLDSSPGWEAAGDKEDTVHIAD